MQAQPDYVHWYAGAVALARSLLNTSAQPHERAKDIVQQAVAQLIERGGHLGSYRQAWFFTVVRNACIDELRRQRRFSSDADGSTHAEVQAGPVEQVLADEQQQQVQRALQRLTLAQREILILRDVNDLSYAMIAQILDINAGTVMSRIHRARMALRAQLQRSELERGELQRGEQADNLAPAQAPKEAI